ncbi:hypothetical protein D7X33_20195 [Butyricicoccus sp. 1XD8-22]|nr:hypothetical protein D7X33_20195 [Butyricicoccus sp. 1XD8-22]
MIRKDVFEMEGMFLTLYRYALVKTVSEYVGKISIEEALTYNVYYSDVDSFHMLFEQLLNELADVVYFFEGDEVEEELKTTPFYPELMELDWHTLFFLPCKSIRKTQIEVDFDFEEVFHRYFKGAQLKATIRHQGIYVGMASESDLGNYLDQLNFIIKVLQESEESSWQESY